MPLPPHYGSNPPKPALWDPIYKHLFEVHYSTSDLTEEESKLLTENTHKIKKNKIYINLNEDGGIYAIDILKKLKTFSLKILSHNKTGEITGIFVYTNCKFPNLLEDIVDFDWEGDDILRPEIEIKYEKLEYISPKDLKRYERVKKFERLLIKNSL